MDEGPEILVIFRVWSLGFLTQVPIGWVRGPEAVVTEPPERIRATPLPGL